MARFLVEGGFRLSGKVEVSGSKNSLLPIIAAAAMAGEGESHIENVAPYTDVLDLCQILRELGANVEWEEENTLRIEASRLNEWVAPYTLARRLRGSSYLLGLLLARMGKAEVAIPGGCEIGSRPIDYHMRGLGMLGAVTRVERGAVLAETEGLRGTSIYVDRASVGTTVNLMLAGSMAQGVTVLDNAAREPEIVDLANFLNGMGAHVRGAGTSLVRIEGVHGLTGTRHEVIPDRIEAGTYLLAAVIGRGKVRVEKMIPEHLRAFLLKLGEAGARVGEGTDWVEVEAEAGLTGIDIQTQPYPGFPTDLQPLFAVALTLAPGVSVVEETIFDNRFGYAGELIRMGASIKVERSTAIVRGVDKLTGAPLEITDLRGGAALILAAMVAEGTSELEGINFLERGYYQLEARLTSLGASIRRSGD